MAQLEKRPRQRGGTAGVHLRWRAGGERAAPRVTEAEAPVLALLVRRRHSLNKSEDAGVIIALD